MEIDFNSTSHSSEFIFIDALIKAINIEMNNAFGRDNMYYTFLGARNRGFI